jgi:hypothetical protein
LLRASDVEPKARAEELDLTRFAALAKGMRARGMLRPEDP